ncbi:MAG: MBL fold metallo-hydrolase [Eggerthellaceae bacterium]|nr:MBL fold metallo-hydrolase [Eggerthellaceae bacterium]
MYQVEELCLQVQFLVMGPIQNNVYIIGSEDAGGLLLVDPSCESERILAALGGRSVDAIVLTHAHWDHVGAAAKMREATGAPVIASDIDAPFITGDARLEAGMQRFEPCPVDKTVSHGDILQIGAMPWKVIGTPGHTPGSMCLFIDPQFGTDVNGAPILISGDTLFCGSIGRTDFAGGSMADMRKSLKRLASLPDETVVLPGHNDLTTIGDERRRVFAYYA